ncbi:hypothetical protein F4781DRAFT_431296 [Annulohypoxylon bovei var. microspora]|nr:hypothetical protein F4781DRAFT_431296 [Annulohypoxylon bovei var. microspora]
MHPISFHHIFESNPSGQHSDQDDQDEINDLDLSIRFKYGVHTIFLFVQPMKSFTDIAEELLEVLADRYPDGLTTFSPEKGKTNLELPDEPRRIEFALPKVPTDLSQGWNALDSAKRETMVDAGIENNTVVAFTFRPSDADPEYEPEFQVDFPELEDDPIEE